MKRLDRSSIEELLLNVQKPARYTGGELNSIVKEEAEIRGAISYPDLYEVAMSNNGVRILYDIANAVEGIACERVFSVARDFENILRAKNIPLYTLETYTPLHQLDLIGFNLAHEMLYTNMLQILDLGLIPLFSDEREEGHPLVIAGGDAVSNPLPVSSFADIIFIGDGEEGFAEIFLTIKKASEESLSRKEIIDRVGKIKGVMIPSQYKLSYRGVAIEKIDGKAVFKRLYREKSGWNPKQPVVPNIRITQERAVYELTRGCGNLCKFCHAGYYDLPYRSFSCQGVPEEIREIILNTGYDELSFVSLSLSDYRYITSVLNSVLPWLTQRGVSVSLPSLKVDMRTISIIEQISDLRKTSLTFAVESASDDIRAYAYKKIAIDDLLSIVEYIFSKGWRLIKLYFMMGLPGYEEHDEAGSIISLLKKIRSIAGKGRDINVTLSPFVPKPHTPFQRKKQAGEDYFNKTIARIKKETPKNIKIKDHDVRSSIIEGVLARGDDRLGNTIYEVYRAGGRFDSWKEHFNYELWKEKLDKTIPFWFDFLDERSETEILPWDIVKTGFENVIDSMMEKKLDYGNLDKKENVCSVPLNTDELKRAVENFKKKFITSGTIRMKISKRGQARFIPHLDFIEIIKRALRMAEVPVAFTQGYNKRERVSFGFPLPLGIESDAEFCDAELYGRVPDKMMNSINSRLPHGIEILSVREIKKKESLMAIAGYACYEVTCKDRSLFDRICSNLNSRIKFSKKTKRGIRDVGFGDAIYDYKIISDNKIEIMLSVGTEKSLRIDNAMLTLAGTAAEDLYKFRIVKISQFTAGTKEPLLIE